MKNVCVAMMCTLAVAACGGEQRPAQEPTTTTTAVTETTTSSRPVTPSTATMNGSTGSSTSATPLPKARTESMTDTTASAGNNGTNAPTGLPSPTPDVGATAAAPAAPTVGATGTAGVNADNTKVNERDRKGTLTPMDQGGGGDRDITAAVRRAVVGDKALSFTAKNVKIITQGGKVTLRGPVKSEEEKTSIEAKAKGTPGVSAVDNQLEVKK